MRVLICSNQICINLFQSFIINVLYSTHIEKVFFVIYIIRNPFDYFDFNSLTPYPHICASQKTGFLYGLPITDLFEIVQPIRGLPVLSHGIDHVSLSTLVEL